jgi:hypothetical protein
VIISVAAIAARLIFSRIQRPAAIALFPAKYISSLPYYSYELIKGKAQPIVLRDASPSSIIGFEKPRDLSSCTIMFSARGERGIEKIAVILRDVNMMSNANPDDIILTTPLSSKNWQRFNIRLKELNLPLDKSRVTQIRFDAREVLTSVAGSGNIYIKDIQTNN